MLKPVFDAFVHNGVRDMFAMCLGAKGGVLMLGGVNEKFLQSNAVVQYAAMDVTTYRMPITQLLVEQSTCQTRTGDMSVKVSKCQKCRGKIAARRTILTSTPQRASPHCRPTTRARWTAAPRSLCCPRASTQRSRARCRMAAVAWTTCAATRPSSPRASASNSTRRLLRCKIILTRVHRNLRTPLTPLLYLDSRPFASKHSHPTTRT